MQQKLFSVYRDASSTADDTKNKTANSIYIRKRWRKSLLHKEHPTRPTDGSCHDKQSCNASRICFFFMLVNSRKHSCEHKKKQPYGFRRIAFHGGSGVILYEHIFLLCVCRIRVFRPKSDRLSVRKKKCFVSFLSTRLRVMCFILFIGTLYTFSSVCV